MLERDDCNEKCKFMKEKKMDRVPRIAVERRDRTERERYIYIMGEIET